MQRVRLSLLGLALSASCASDDAQQMSSADPWVPDSSSGSSTSRGPTSADPTMEGSSAGPGGSGATSSGSSMSGGTTTPDLGTTGGETTDSGDSTGTADYDGEPGEFVLEFDERAYRLYVPSGYVPTSPIPVVVGFHGAGDTGGNFYAIANSVGLTTAAEPANYIVVVPDTKSPYSDFAIWSGNPSNDVDEMLVEMDEVLDLIEDLGTHYHIASDRRHAFGFSDGGLFTAVAGMARSEQFASLSVLGYGWGGNYPLVTPERSIPTQFACGSNDGFYSGAVSSESFLAGQGHPTRLVTANGVGHTFTGISSAMPAADMFQWMNMHAAP